MREFLPTILPYKPLLKAARGTPSYPLVRALLRELLDERTMRKRVMALREDQSRRLFWAAAELSLRRHITHLTVGE